MKLYLLVIVLILSLGASTAFSQSRSNSTDKKHKAKVGLKAGYNFAKVIGSTPDFTPQNNNGYMISGFFSPSVKNGFGYRTELVYSRQGFSFDESGKMQNIAQQYLYMPQLTTFTIANIVQLQAGGQIGYLLHAKNTTPPSNSSQQTQVTDYMNRLDYGVAGGFELYPVGGLIIGGRYNVSLGNIYKQNAGTSLYPSPFPFDPSQVKGKNAVVQFFIGYRF